MRLQSVALALLSVLGAASAQAQQYATSRPNYGSSVPVVYDEGTVDASGQPVLDPGLVNSAMAPATSCAATGSCSDYEACGCEECCESCGLLDRLRPNICWRPQGMFTEFEYNMWWTKTRTLPPLVTTSPGGTALASTGVLPGATTLFGGERVAEDLGHGGRLTFGKWLDPYQSAALLARFTAFRADDGDFSIASDGTTNLAIPFIDAQLGTENAYLVAFTPDGTTAFASGNIDVEDRLDMVMGELYGQFLLYDEPGTRFDMFGGYHMMRLDNSLSINSTLTSLNAAIVTPVGTEIFVQDAFEGRNEFHGGSLGVLATLDFDRWFVNASAKMSVGNMNQTIIIDGNTVVTTPGPVVDVRDEGLFALGTNQGVRSRDRIAYIPEATLKLGYRLRRNMAVSMGYNFMYISRVVLAGDQLDRTVNLSQTNGGALLGPARPEFRGFRETDFWAQGLNFNLEVAF